MLLVAQRILSNYEIEIVDCIHVEMKVITNQLHVESLIDSDKELLSCCYTALVPISDTTTFKDRVHVCVCVCVCMRYSSNQKLSWV